MLYVCHLCIYYYVLFIQSTMSSVVKRLSRLPNTQKVSSSFLGGKIRFTQANYLSFAFSALVIKPLLIFNNLF